MGVIWPLGAFAAYTLLVSCYWASELAEPKVMWNPAYYAFNFLAVIAFGRTSSWGPERFLRFFAGCMGASVLVQGVLAIPAFASAYRMTSGFNNPNQLGYYSVLAATVIAVAHRHVGLSAWIAGAGLGGSLFLAAVSLSKAAFLGVIAFGLLVVPRGARLVVPALAIVLILAQFVPVSEVQRRVTQRFESIGKDPDDSLEARGYDLVWRYPEYLIFGAAEGTDYRFGRKVEIHSTFAAVLFYYGLPGMALFCWGLFRVWRLCRLGVFQFAAPALVYGLAHHGLRFTEFWLMLGYLCCTGAVIKIRHEVLPTREPRVGGVKTRRGRLRLSQALPGIRSTWS